MAKQLDIFSEKTQARMGADGRWKHYPAYKDSGIEWLGEVPEHWGVSPLKAFAQSGYRTFTDGDWIETPYITEEGIRLVQTGNIGVGQYREQGFRYISEETFHDLRCTEVCPGDVLICRLADPVGRACIAPDLGVRMITSVDVCILKPGADVDPRFIVYALSSPSYLSWMGSICRGGTRDRISRSMLGSVRLQTPPEPEQRAIAAFLDRETARIDALIEKKQRQIELLQEKRAALISHAVTKGLNPNAPMKDSGIEWLGEIPEHWTMRCVKYMTQILRGKFTHRPRNDPRMYDGPYPFIQTGDVSSASKYIREYHQTLSEEGFTVSKMFPEGTLVMTIAANIGDMAVLDFEACFPDSIVGFVPRRDVALDFLYYLFIGMRPALVSTATLNTQFNLNIERIGSVVAVQPPLDEQLAIVERLETQAGQSNELAARIIVSVEQLREYRTALISAAVTGKIDVRGEVA